jgi:hypothetical protein
MMATKAMIIIVTTNRGSSNMALKGEQSLDLLTALSL